MKKTITLNILIICILFIFIELIAARAFFQRNTIHNTLSTTWLIEGVARVIDKKIAQKTGNKTKEFDLDRVFLYPESPIEIKFRHYLLSKYEKTFQNFVNQASNDGAEILIFWTPTRKLLDKNLVYEAYFKQLAKKTNTHFVSMRNLLTEKEEHVFMLPYDDHLTRYSNYLIADRLTSFINENITYKRKGFNCSNIGGNFKPNSSILWPVLPEVPYIMSTDEFGFRKTQLNSYDQNNYNILTLGPSFTFGPYLNFYDTYPSILSRYNENWNVINAGIAGIGLESSISILKKNSKCLNPAIVILQVLANDIKKSAVTEYNENNFLGEILDIPALEKMYYSSVK